MTSVRLVPILGLFVALALVPGALAHHCSPSGDPSQDESLSAQSVPPAASPSTIVALALVPIVGLLAAVAIAIPSMRKANPQSGTWQFDGTRYVWAPTKK